MIDHEGAQRGIIPTSEAMEIAASAGLQLVEVNPKANPPVCKIMDYGKYKYETAKRERETKRHQKVLELKEVKFRPKTHGHDFDFKLRHVRRFIDDGDKVKLVVQFRGREVIHPETGRAILDRVCEGAADVASVIQSAHMEGNRMNMVLAPKAGKQPKPRQRSPRPEGESNRGNSSRSTTPSAAAKPSPPAAEAAPPATEKPTEKAAEPDAAPASEAKE